MAKTGNIITTWNSKSQKPTEAKFPEKCHSNRNRINKPNHLPYGPAHSDFYKLPYETREELRRERRIVKNKGILPVIAEGEEDKDIDSDETPPLTRKFPSFNKNSLDAIAKEDIEGKHFRRKTSYSTEQINEFFKNIQPQKLLKRSSSFTEFLNEQDNITFEFRGSRSNSF
jgi:hypothetical protein